MKKIILFLFGLIVWLLNPSAIQAQPNDNSNNGFLDGYKFRSIGPFRGGRVTAVTGVESDPLKFYMGSTGGGVWLTNDAGTTWHNISDGFFKVGSIGAIAVAPSDENVMYVGTGSACPRGNISIGNGVYKSTDRGITWTHIGLDKSGMIGKIIVDPTDDAVVYVAALGNPFGPNTDRGVYKSVDGGITWNKVHFISERTGAVDLVMDPSNKRVLYAAMWTVERKPWTLIDGSEESGIWKSVDAGNSWKVVHGGLPEGQIGRSGITISPANPERMWVIMETAEEKHGGVYRSYDRGKSWTRINREHNLRQRAWYYNHITAHPTEQNTVFVMNAGFYKSIDGGKTFGRLSTPHGDNHGLWINPHNPKIMIEANDGGACVTLNGGATWSSQNNQPTAEFYRVSVDNEFPYRVYGAQQDNSTISVSSIPQNSLDPIQDWQSVGGGESGHIAIDPRDPSIIYAGTYIGQIDRSDLKQAHQQDIVAYPQMHDGTAPRDIKYRFQWNAPIFISPHDPDKVYHCSQYVHLTTNQGLTWKTISPDLTTNNDDHQNIPGGPIQHDHTGVELYNTIFAFGESPINPGELWAGSDDGLLHLSKDDGKNWINITPKMMTKDGTINSIELSKHQAGRAILAVYKYRENDFKPYIFLTENHGKSWINLVNNNGIPQNHFVRVVREDPNDQGILYAGTEFGLYISMDNGKQWISFQNNLPITPITDMSIHQGDLVIATQGRSFWILDNISAISQWKHHQRKLSKSILFDMPIAIRSQYKQYRGASVPDRAPSGAWIEFYLDELPTEEDQFLLSIKDEANVTRRKFSPEVDKDSHIEKITLRQGLNRFQWDLRYEKPEPQPKSVFSLASLSGIKAPPGNHQVEFKFKDETITKPLVLSKDPRWTQADEDLVQQYELTMQVKALFDQSHQTIGTLRKILKQIDGLTDRVQLQNQDTILARCKKIQKSSKDLENQLIQTKSESGQDPINHPSMIDDQIAYLYSNLNGQDHKPSKGTVERYKDLEIAMKPLLDEADTILDEVNDLNNRLLKLELPMIDVQLKREKP